MIDKNRLHVGMKVRIVYDLDAAGDDADCGIDHDMYRWEGRVMTIRRIADSSNNKKFSIAKMNEDPEDWWWSNQWMEEINLLDDNLFTL